MMVPPHPDPSASIPSLVARMPPLVVIVNVGVLVPSLLTVKAAMVLVPDRQLPISVPLGDVTVPWM